MFRKQSRSVGIDLTGIVRTLAYPTLTTLWSEGRDNTDEKSLSGTRQAEKLAEVIEEQLGEASIGSSVKETFHSISTVSLSLMVYYLMFKNGIWDLNLCRLTELRVPFHVYAHNI